MGFSLNSCAGAKPMEIASGVKRAARNWR